MKSKGVFIIIGGFLCIAALLIYLGFEAELIILLSGAVMIIAGLFLLKQEISWRKNSDTVPARVSRYYEYKHGMNDESVGLNMMYTMEAEYTTLTGKTVRAREQSGSTNKKYAPGAEIRVRYSRENPELFIIEGDNSRIYAMLAVIGMGAAIIVIFGSIFFKLIHVE